MYFNVHDSLHHRNSLPFCEHFQLSQVPTRSHPLSSSFHFLSLSTAHFCGTPYLMSFCRLKVSLILFSPLSFSFLLYCCVLILRCLFCFCTILLFCPCIPSNFIVFFNVLCYCMYVFVGSMFAGLLFCATQSFDKIDNK